MLPITHFDLLWKRCDDIADVYSYLRKNTSDILNLDEILRSEWVLRVGALDTYIHELVAQSMLDIFEGRKKTTLQYNNFKISNETLSRIHGATTKPEATSAYDLEVRTQLTRITYQAPEDIADGIRIFSEIKLWQEVAVGLGATNKTKEDDAKKLKKDVSLIVNRRNKIAHEGDLQPIATREPWPIAAADLVYVKTTIETIVRTIDKITF